MHTLAKTTAEQLYKALTTNNPIPRNAETKALIDKHEALHTKTLNNLPMHEFCKVHAYYDAYGAIPYIAYVADTMLASTTYMYDSYTCLDIRDHICFPILASSKIDIALTNLRQEFVDTTPKLKNVRPCLFVTTYTDDFEEQKALRIEWLTFLSEQS